MAEQTFFTKQKSTEVKPVAIRRGPLFRRATFRYTGRVLQEIKEMPSPQRTEPSFDRSHLQRQMPRDERSAPWANKFHTLPRATKPAPGINEKPTTQANKEGQDRTASARDSLAVDTTAQATPIITPLSGLSPVSANGVSSPEANVTVSSVDESLTISTKGTSTSGVYKQDSVTVSLKHVEPVEQAAKEVDRLAKTAQEEARRPLSTSTPKPLDTEKRESKLGLKERQTNGAPVTPTSKAISEEKVTTSKGFAVAATPSTPPTSSVTQATPQQAARGRGGVGRALMKTILSGVMFTIILIGTIIVVMEIQDPQFRGYLRNVPGEDTFRHQYYEPSRQRALEWYERVSGRRVQYSE